MVAYISTRLTYFKIKHVLLHLFHPQNHFTTKINMAQLMTRQNVSLSQIFLRIFMHHFTILYDVVSNEFSKRIILLGHYYQVVLHW